MAPKVEITGKMVNDAYNDGDTRDTLLDRSPYRMEWTDRVARNLTKQLNTKWSADGVHVKHGDGTRVTVDLSIFPDHLRHGQDTEGREEFARRLADLLNEQEFDGRG